MNIYFDTEFTGLHNGTTLISIGLVDENGRSFYAELTDYDKNQVTDWINDNVIKNLTNPILELTGDHWKITGIKAMVKTALNKWLEEYGNEQITLVSDVCHYDMVMFISLYGDAFHIPDMITPACYDINQDIANHYNISLKKAFDINREELSENLGFSVDENNKHNSLFDALIIKNIYEGLHKK